MSLRLFDSLTAKTSTFVPLRPAQVSIYVCGATVQASPHIGHLRSAIAFDILRRWLQRSGYQVTFIRNVTDIDDKILTKAAAASVPWWQWAYLHQQEFTAAYDAVGVLPPSFEPLATGHIPQMIELIDSLIRSGHAYVGSAADVYFDVQSWPEYGALTHQQGENLTVGADAQEADKRSPRDFALWKGRKDTEPATASWQAPWGPGRPGWHIECSAMAARYLGEAFDIHGGGLDLRFPHHENELAQSQAAGQPFAQRWMHNGWVTVSGEKMSKSLGNSLTVTEVLKEHPAVALRYALGAVHYRSMVEYSPQRSLAEAAAAWERLRGFVHRALEADPRVATAPLEAVELPAEFSAALDDDLNVPVALACVHEHTRAGNTALSSHQGATEIALQVRAMLAVLGLDPLDAQWNAATHSAADGALAALIPQLLSVRDAARTARDWTTADTVRDQLAAAGVTIADGPDGSTWYLEAH